MLFLLATLHEKKIRATTPKSRGQAPQYQLDNGWTRQMLGARQSQIWNIGKYDWQDDTTALQK